MSDNKRFDVLQSGKTMINGVNKNYFTTNFITDNLAVYALRVANDNTVARVCYISIDRGQANHSWRGEIAEVIVFDKLLTNEEMKEVNTYLMQKFGL
ncbi:hypothetical protein JSO56_08950 [Riemerella anatipestifer]|uniref:hypothetical protein n=1 Tax=Riemerella anatipestifer TaxID=34085 RepID=UPI0030BE72DF